VLSSSWKACVFACIVAAALAAAVVPTAPASKSAHRAGVNKHRAIAAYRAMQRAYYHRSEGLYKLGRRKRRPYANAWPYGQTVAATISLAELSGLRGKYRKDVRARLRGLEKYADREAPPPADYLSKVAPPHGPGGDRYNDDNEWFGIELVRAHHVTRMPTLNKARRVFDKIDSTWDTRTNVRCPGGIPQAPRVNGDRNTVSNAPAAELGVQLFFRTHDPRYLQSARRMYDWVRGCLLTPEGLYADHVDRRDRIDPTKWTYNQGSMIGAGVMLYQATHDRAYLEQAKSTAQTALRYYGPVRLKHQPLYFHAIYIRNLLLLGAATGDGRYRNFAERLAAHQWNRKRNRHTGLFSGHARGQGQLLDQAAMVQIYALLGLRPRAYF
jgi:Glycosyl hydrolase family 76